MPPHATHSDDQLRGGARDFCAVLGQVPLAFMWESYFTLAFATSSVPPNVKEALHNATIESSLLNIRLLNDFFAPRRYPTHIRAEDYVGYASPGQFLDSDEARAPNKHLAHLTTERLLLPHARGYLRHDSPCSRCRSHFHSVS